MKKLILFIFLLYGTYMQAIELCCDCKWYDLVNVIQCNNILNLINATGGVNGDMFVYDQTNMRQSHLAGYIYLQDDAPCITGSKKDTLYLGAGAYIYMRAFYEVIGKHPNEFAKSMMRKFLFQDIQEKSLYVLRFAGWEYLQGEILPLDTLLGKNYLSMAAGIPMDSLEAYILPFWRDSIAKNEYKHRHDSILSVFGTRWKYPATIAVIEHGDTLTYKKIIEEDVYGDRMIYSIYMIDQYNYLPAYQDIYTTLKKVYNTHHGQMHQYALKWLFSFYLDNNMSIPDQIYHELKNNYSE